jgi:hypothetical protein
MGGKAVLTLCEHAFKEYYGMELKDVSDVARDLWVAGWNAGLHQMKNQADLLIGETNRLEEPKKEEKKYDFSI